jgi:hypothetical protein
MTDNARQYVEQRYRDVIAYYGRAGRLNKSAYKWARYLTIVLGSAVTLIASLSSAEFLKGQATLFAILTPVLAGLLTILGGFSQTFQWGASWREMILVQERVQKEFDRITVTPDGQLDPEADLLLLNNLVIDESSGFFDRVMGSSSPADGAHRDGRTAPIQRSPSPPPAAGAVG